MLLSMVICQLGAPFVRVHSFVHRIVNRMPSPQAPAPNEGENQRKSDSGAQDLLM